jgi:peptide maturation system protein (TIGR04066 family)
MKKIAIFPFDYYLLPVIKNKDNLLDFQLSQVFSLQGWGMVNDTVSASCKDDTAEDIVVMDIFDESVDFDFDILYITNSNHKIDDDLLYRCIERAAKRQKNILVSKKLSTEQMEQIKAICKQNNVHVQFLYADVSTDIINDTAEMLYSIDTPIISVSGVDENTNKFEVQLELYNRLKKDGYSVSWVSSRNEMLLCGEHPLPDFMFQTSISETQKILMYNHFVKFIEEQESPDVIILGIPGEMMPNSKLQVGHFGTTAFQIFNAVNPDFSVLCVHCNGNNEDYFDRLLQAMEYKFSVETDCIYISSISKDPFSLNKITPVEYVLYNNDFTTAVISQIAYDSCPQFGRNTYEKLYQFAVDRLHGYDDLQVM